MSTDYGNFHNFCRDSTLPICNLYNEGRAKNPTLAGNDVNGFGGCRLVGFGVGGDQVLGNLGSIILCAIAILVSFGLIFLSQRKRAAVGRREMQLFLIGYIIISICEIFTVGGFPLSGTVIIAFTGIHIGMIVATTWILMLNGAVGFQLIDDGTPLSMILILASSAALFIGTGYIALDTGYNWSGYWETGTIQNAPNRQYSLYTLYLLVPIVFLFIYGVLATVLVVTVLKESKPMLWLGLALFSFAVGQVFDFVISVHICNGTSGKIDGALFETLFTLVAVIFVYIFWSSITEDDWPEEARDEASY